MTGKRRDGVVSSFTSRVPDAVQRACAAPQSRHRLHGISTNGPRISSAPLRS
jgi:hypothetical protein